VEREEFQNGGGWVEANRMRGTFDPKNARKWGETVLGANLGYSDGEVKGAK